MLIPDFFLIFEYIQPIVVPIIGIIFRPKK